MFTKYLLALSLLLLPLTSSAKAPVVSPIEGNLLVERLKGAWLTDKPLIAEMKRGGKASFRFVVFTPNAEVLSKLPADKQVALMTVAGEQPIIAAGDLTITVKPGKSIKGAYAITLKSGHAFATFFLSTEKKGPYGNIDTSFLSLIPGPTVDRLFVMGSEQAGKRVIPNAAGGAIVLKKTSPDSPEGAQKSGGAK